LAERKRVEAKRKKGKGRRPTSWRSQQNISSPQRKLWDEDPRHEHKPRQGRHNQTSQISL
jgi:hypothetical protein